jgi:hypothetical protein
LAENRPGRPKYALNKQPGKYRGSGGSRLAFIFVPILFIVLAVFLFNALSTNEQPTQLAPSPTFIPPRATKPPPSTPEPRATEALRLPDYDLYLPVILR